MKIIGAATDTYIVEVSKSELAQIMGYYSNYDKEFMRTIKSAVNGSNIPISNIYKNYCDVKSIVQSPEYDTARTKLKNMLDALTPLEELITKLSKEYEANKA